jgi:hypothetical protein
LKLIKSLKLNDLSDDERVRLESDQKQTQARQNALQKLLQSLEGVQKLTVEEVRKICAGKQYFDTTPRAQSTPY